MNPANSILQMRHSNHTRLNSDHSRWFAYVLRRFLVMLLAASLSLARGPLIPLSPTPVPHSAYGNPSIDSTQPILSFGSANTLLVMRSTMLDAYTCLSFDVRDIPGSAPIKGASLEIYLSAWGGARPHPVYLHGATAEGAAGALPFGGCCLVAGARRDGRWKPETAT